MYEGFCSYQKALLAEFDVLCTQFGLETVDASVDVKTVFSVLKARILNVLEDSNKVELSKAPSYIPADRRASTHPKVPWFLPGTNGKHFELLLQPFAANLAAGSNGNGNGNHNRH